MSSRVTSRASAPPRYPASKGFTLLEVLIALTLLGLIFSLLWGVFRFTTSAWESAGHRMARSNQISAVQDLLRSEVSQARMLLIGSGRSEPNRTFKGLRRELEFAAPLPAHMGAGGYYLFSLHATEIRGRQGLALAWQIYRPDMFARGRDQHREEAVLLDDVGGIAFAYYGQSQEDEQPVWTDDWGDRRNLPKLVRIRVNFAAGERRYWPELDIELKSEGGP
ncbi:MAG: prepilin-type N-terminal cleavage/methylation protein [Rhodospirillales bacterium]|nr:prepilin-type N-terminal cleavage/methylation protein [Rhodospirillales bacterium]